MNEKNISIEEAYKTALDLHTKGRINDAKDIYQKILKIKPDHFFSLTNLGIIFAQLRKFDEAVELFNKVIKANPKYAEGYNNLGNVMLELSEFDKSLNYYKKAIELNPSYFDAFNNLGNVYQKKDNLNKAIECYESAIAINSELNKDKPYYNLGNIFRELGNLEKSIEFYKKAIEINQNNIDAYINISISLNQIGDFKKAIFYCGKAIEKDPRNVTATNNLGKYHQEIGNDDLSMSLYKKAIDLDPKNLRSRWLLMNMFPIIYKNFGQIDFFRRHFEKNLTIIENLINEKNIFNKNQILSSLNSCTNFYLHYQGGDVRNLQERYGSVIQKLTKRIYPQLHNKIELNKNSKFIKVGFISSFFFEHVISKLFKNWILKLNKNNFNTYVYHIGTKNDHLTNQIKSNCYSFFNEINLDKTIDKIISDKLDVIIFLDIGMEPKMQILGSLRLAPFQCCAYGVPVTTGLKNIDYYLTSKIMETDNSEKNYSEKLVKIPALGINYENPIKIDIHDSIIKKKNDEIIFLNLQSNYKLLPQHDHIYFEILRKNPKCKFWFIGSKNEFIAGKFKERLSIICQQKHISLNDFFTFYPQMSYDKYLDLIKKSDIILDSFEWSGLNTSLDAISLNKPVITSPSNFMRGRHTYGILKILKIDELICSSKEDYIDLAIKLSKNLYFRNQIQKKINDNKNLLFNNSKTIEFLEDFLMSLFK